MAERLRVQSCIRMLQLGDFSSSKSLIGVCLQIVRPASHGARFGVVVAVDVGLADEDVYRQVMTLSLHSITTRGIWHIVRLYHRMFMRSMCVETMCESVASTLRYIERKNSVGRDTSLKTIVVAARLRCAGLRGDLSDAAFIWRALCHLFGTHDPERMHFMRRQPRRGSGGRMVLDDKYVHGPSCAVSQARARSFRAGTAAARQEWINSAGLPALCKALDVNRLKSTRAAVGMDDYTSQSFTPEARGVAAPCGGGRRHVLERLHGDVAWCRRPSSCSSCWPALAWCLPRATAAPLSRRTPPTMANNSTHGTKNNRPNR